MTDRGPARADRPGPVPPYAPGGRPGPPPASGAGVTGGSGSEPCRAGLAGIRYLVAVALLVALVWIPALIMIVAAHQSLRF